MTPDQAREWGLIDLIVVKNPHVASAVTWYRSVAAPVPLLRYRYSDSRYMTRRYRPFDPFDRGGPFEGGREIKLPRPPRRFWVGAGIIGIAFLVFVFASPIVGFFTELQW